MEIDINPFILIFAIASIVAILAKRMRIPYTITLVIAGIAVAMVGLEAPFKLDKDLIFHILLPPLLFEAGLHMRLNHLKKNLKVITLLVLPGMIVSLIVVSMVISALFPALPFMVVLLFVAIITPTDPVSILALFREMKVPRRVSIIVEGESVFNDGVAIVVFNVVLAMILTSGQSASMTVGDIGFGIFDFFRLTVIGVLLGIGVGYLGYRMLQRIDDRFTEMMITIILAFSVYAVAETLGGSGVFAVVFSALVLGNYGTRFAMAPSTRLALVNFWSFMAFVVNSFLFLLIGMDVHFTGSGTELGLIILGTVMMFGSRAAMVYVVGKVMNRRKTELPRRWQIIIWWGGIRGAVPIALALSIPAVLLATNSLGEPLEFPYQDLLRSATFGVVLFSLLIQGLTLKPLLRALGFTTGSREETERDMKETSVLLRDSMGELSSMRDEGLLSDRAFNWLSARYSLANSQLLTELGMMVNEHGFVPKDEYVLAVKETLESKRSAVKEAWEKGLISGSIGEKLVMELSDHIGSLEVDVDAGLPATAADILRNVGVKRRADADGIPRSCGICLQPVGEGQETYTCRCGTTFHRACLAGVDRCPVCIAVLDLDDGNDGASAPLQPADRSGGSAQKEIYNG